MDATFGPPFAKDGKYSSVQKKETFEDIPAHFRRSTPLKSNVFQWHEIATRPIRTCMLVVWLERASNGSGEKKLWLLF
jgi:hypothetical protein